MQAISEAVLQYSEQYEARKREQAHAAASEHRAHHLALAEVAKHGVSLAFAAREECRRTLEFVRTLRGSPEFWLSAPLGPTGHYRTVSRDD